MVSLTTNKLSMKVMHTLKISKKNKKYPAKMDCTVEKLLE